MSRDVNVFDGQLVGVVASTVGHSLSVPHTAHADTPTAETLPSLKSHQNGFELVELTPIRAGTG